MHTPYSGLQAASRRAAVPARPWGRVVPRRWLLAGSAGASALLVVYGGLNVLLGVLVLSAAIHPAGSVDRTALRWHVGLWDLWFLVWGILLALATADYWRRTRQPNRRQRWQAGSQSS